MSLLALFLLGQAPSLRLLKTEPYPFGADLIASPRTSSRYALTRLDRQRLFRFRVEERRRELLETASSALLGTDSDGLPVLGPPPAYDSVDATGTRKPYADAVDSPTYRDGVMAQRPSMRRIVLSWPRRPLVRFDDDRIVSTYAASRFEKNGSPRKPARVVLLSQQAKVEFVDHGARVGFRSDARSQRPVGTLDDDRRNVGVFFCLPERRV